MKEYAKLATVLPNKHLRFEQFQIVRCCRYCGYIREKYLEIVLGGIPKVCPDCGERNWHEEKTARRVYDTRWWRYFGDRFIRWEMKEEDEFIYIKVPNEPGLKEFFADKKAFLHSVNQYTCLFFKD